MTFNEKAAHLRTEVDGLITKHAVPISDVDRGCIDDAIDALIDHHADDMQRLEDRVKEPEDEVEDNEETIRELKSDEDAPEFDTFETYGNDAVTLIRPDNLQDAQVIETLSLCFRTGRIPQLINHLEQFAKAYGTANLIP